MFDNFDNNVLEILEDSKKYTNKHFKLFKIGTESLLYVMLLSPSTVSWSVIASVLIFLFIASFINSLGVNSPSE